MREWSVPGYSEVRVLGSGGFGEVVLARHDASGTLVAVKYVHPGKLAEDPRFTELFRAEAAMLASVDDPHVVRLYEYVEAPGGAAIVMELVDGTSVREIVAHQGATSAEAALVVLQGSLLGLAAAHAAGVVHRDYKPENVLVDGAGVSKLTDFGIAARSGERALPAGTWAYAPPEQWAGGPASPAGDVYAATATFYECLAGHPPFAGSTAEQMLYLHTSVPVPLDPVPEPLRPLVSAGMAKDPASRPADAASFVTALAEVAWPAYGRDWEERGRSHLGEAALLLAALWPSAAPPAVQGHAVQQVHLSQGSQESQDPEHLRHLDHLRHLEHVEHLEHLEHEHAEHVEHVEHLEHEHAEHIEHVEHLEHLERLGESPASHSGLGTTAAEGGEPAAGVAGAAGGAASAAGVAGAAAAASSPGPAAAPATGLRRLARYSRRALSAGHGAGAAVAVAIVAALVIGTVLASSGGGPAASSRGPAASGGGPTSNSGPAPASIPLTATSGLPMVTGDVYVQYHDGSDSSAVLKGAVPSPAAGEVVRLYAQQFPFSAAPVPAGTSELGSANGNADFSFSVTPTLATRYQVKVFSSATATVPQAVSATTTIYVVATWNFDVTHCSARPFCRGQYVGTVYVPPSTMSVELNKQWYVYIGVALGPPGSSVNAAPAWLLLANGSPPLANGTATVSAPQQTGADSYSATINDSYNWGNHAWTALYWDACSMDTEAQDGLGLPGSNGCGAARIANGTDYLGQGIVTVVASN